MTFKSRVPTHWLECNVKRLIRGQSILYNLLISLIDNYSFLNVFKYLTFRTGLSVGTSLVIVFLIRTFIKLSSKHQISGPIRQDGPIDHIITKTGTPIWRTHNYWYDREHLALG